MVAMSGLRPGKVRHEFAADLSPHSRAFLSHSFQPRMLLNDMTAPEAESCPRVHIYSCGFPCQPWSAAGPRTGLADSRASQPIVAMLRYIIQKQPLVFVLENVKRFTETPNKNIFEEIGHNKESSKQEDLFFFHLGQGICRNTANLPFGGALPWQDLLAVLGKISDATGPVYKVYKTPSFSWIGYPQNARGSSK